jgi:hypothetical protein
MTTKHYLIAALMSWCLFWWGFSLGMNTAADSELAQSKADAELSRQIQASCNPDCSAAVVASLDDLRLTRARMLEETRAGPLDLLLAPITAPIGVFALASVRQGATRR